jgi:hypothetical protein
MLLYHGGQLRGSSVQQAFQVAALLTEVDMTLLLLLFQHFLHESFAHGKAGR